MSTYFRSYIIYGVKIPYKEFEEIIGDAIWEDDGLRIGNNPENIGWEADGMSGEWSLYGKIIHNGSDNGNDNPLGGAGDMKELKLLTDNEKEKMSILIAQHVGEKYRDKASYYVVGEYY